MNFLAHSHISDQQKISKSPTITDSKALHFYQCYMLVCCCFFFFNSTFTMIIKVFFIHRLIGLVGKVYANGPGDLGSIPGRVIPKTLKIVLDTSLLNTQRYKVHIKGKMEQSRERSSASLTTWCSS